MTMQDTPKLTGKVALITGGGRGIGKAIALRFAQEGAALVLCGRTVAALEEVCHAAHQMGSAAVPVQADVSSEADVERVRDTALHVFGQIDILVNNAGVAGPLGLITTISKQAWDDTLRINLTGMFLCAREVLKPMMTRRTGNIINLSSGAGLKTLRVRSLPYGISKWGVEGLTYALAVQMKPYGICVNALRPGPHDTGMHQETPPEWRTGAWQHLRKPNGVSTLAVELALHTVDTMTGEAIDFVTWEKQSRQD
jgi:NAD(P)-dependent dehydrogenase (short-subunit alcohol dehydrogenase family)